MRKALLLMSAAVVTACAAPAYQAPAVRVAPSYAALARESSTRAVADSSGSVPATGVAVRASAGRVDAIGQSAQYSTEVSSEPFWREIGDATLARLIEEALRARP